MAIERRTVHDACRKNPHCIKVDGHPGICELGYGLSSYPAEGGSSTPAAGFKYVQPGGATRFEKKPRFDLIASRPMKRIAARYEMGLHHGEHNWKKGMPFDETYNHLIDHLHSYLYRRKRYFELKENGGLLDEYNTHAQIVGLKNLPTLKEWMKATETDGDDLAAAAWNVIALMALEDEDKLL